MNLSEKRAQAGRLGGIQTRLRYGDDYLRELGRRGGLNHGGYLSETEIQMRRKKNEEEVRLTDINSHRELLRVWKNRQAAATA